MQQVQDPLRDGRVALAETGVKAFVEKVEDIQQIMSFDILMTPGLVIDGQVKIAGRVPDLAEVKELIQAAPGQCITHRVKGASEMGGDPAHPEQVLVVPCSGIGKVHGLVSREATYSALELLPGQADTVCLALLVRATPKRGRKCGSIPASPWTAAPSCAPEERRAGRRQGRPGRAGVRHDSNAIAARTSAPSRP